MKFPVFLLLLLFAPLWAQDSFDKLNEADIKRLKEAIAKPGLRKEIREHYQKVLEELENGQGRLRTYEPTDTWNLVDIQTIPESGSLASEKQYQFGQNTYDFTYQTTASPKQITRHITKTSKFPGKDDVKTFAGYTVDFTLPPAKLKPGELYVLSTTSVTYANGSVHIPQGPPVSVKPRTRFIYSSGMTIAPPERVSTLKHFTPEGQLSRRNEYGESIVHPWENQSQKIERTVRFQFPTQGPPFYFRVGIEAGPSRIVYVYKYKGKVLPRLALEALDANPTFHEDTLPEDLKSLQLIESGVRREGTTADGASRLIIRAELPTKSKAQFSILEPDSGTITPLLKGTTIFHEDRHYAFALYTPPATFNPDRKPPKALFDPDLAPKQRLNNILEYRDLTIEVTTTDSPKKSALKLKLARPPVVLVHGLGSNPHECWVFTKPLGTSMVALLEKAGLLPFTVNYQTTNGIGDHGAGSSFRANTSAVWDRADPFTLIPDEKKGWIDEPEVPPVSQFQKEEPNRIGGIKHALQHYREELNLAATKADVVGHSMGGLLSRCYASPHYNPDYKRPANFHEGDINRLITLNTPHHGSELAHLYEALTKAYVAKESWTDWATRSVGSAYCSLFIFSPTPAVRDLTAPRTIDDVKESALAAIGPTQVPSFAIATTADTNQLGSTEFDFELKYRRLFGAVGMAFFYNRPLLDDFVRSRFAQWEQAPDELRQGPVTPSGTTISPRQPQTVEQYLETLHAVIDHNALYWASQREAIYREKLAKSLPKTAIVPFGTIDSDREDELDQGTMSLKDRAISIILGGDHTKLIKPHSNQDVPIPAVGLIRSLIYHNDPANDGAVRVVSQYGGLPPSATKLLGNQPGETGIIHSYSPWHYRVQREVITLLKWENGRFDPTGFPEAGQLTPRHLPSTDLIQARTAGEKAIRWAGIVPSHAEAYASVADESKAVILVRPVNRDSTALIAAGNATKAMAVKGKSSNWGPQKGFIPVEQRFSKLWRVFKNNPAERASQIKKYDAITQEVLAEAHPTRPGRKYVKPASLVQDGYEVLALPTPGTEGAASTEDDAEKAVVLRKDGKYFDWETRQARSLDADQIKSLKPLEVLAVDQDSEKPLYVTADYDLLAIGIHDASIVSDPDSYHHGPIEEVRESKFDPLMGFVSTTQKTIIESLNDEVKAAGYDGGFVTHHGPEVQYHKSPYVDYPILVCDPGKPEVRGDQTIFIIHQGPPGFRDIHLKRYFSEQIRKGYNLWPNPDSKGWLWEHYRDFSITVGYDPTDSPLLLPYVTEQTDPDLDKIDPQQADEGVAVKYYQQKAIEGDPEAQAQLAQHHLNSGKNLDLAFDLATESADRGHSQGMVTLAQFDLFDQRPDARPFRGIQLLEDAIKTDNNADAQYLLGFVRFHGIGTEPAPGVGVKHFEAAAAQGQGDAFLELAHLHFDGNHLPNDLRKAFELYQKAAEKDIFEAHLALAHYFLYDILGEKDFKKALDHLTRSLELEDNPEAHYCLGFIYSEGSPDIPKDPQQAVGHFRAAARSGHPNGQLSFAYCLQDGFGTPINLPLAHAWFKLAFLNGNEQAGEPLNQLTRSLTPEQLEEAEAHHQILTSRQ